MKIILLEFLCLLTRMFLLLTGAGEEEKGEGRVGLCEKETTQQIKGES